jgi:hypothetical protein
MNRDHVADSLIGLRQELIIFARPAIAVEPAQGALDNSLDEIQAHGPVWPQRPHLEPNEGGASL